MSSRVSGNAVASSTQGLARMHPAGSHSMNMAVDSETRMSWAETRENGDMKYASAFCVSSHAHPGGSTSTRFREYNRGNIEHQVMSADS